MRGIEGLRALAAMSVLVTHVWDSASAQTYGSHGLNFPGIGPVLNNLRGGVALFFVLSGFLLYRPFARAVLRGERLPSIPRYLRNRALRILPLFWTLMLLFALTIQRGLLDRPAQAAADFLFLQNSVPGYQPTNGFYGFGITPAWSLCVEMVFYLVLPGLAWVAYKRRNPWTPVIGMAILGIACKAVGEIAGMGAVWGMSFPVHADWFAAGMTVACLHARGVRVGRRGHWLALAGALALAAASTKAQSSGYVGFPVGQSFMAVAGALLLASVLFGPERAPVVRLLETRPLFTAGVWSYGIFLWQAPLLTELRDHGLTRAGTAGFLWNLLLVSAVTIACAAITYQLVERPALSLKKRTAEGRRTRPEPAMSAPEAAAAP